MVRRSFIVMFTVLAIAASASAQSEWTHRGWTSARNGVVTGGTPMPIDEPRFVVNGGRTLMGQSTPAVADQKVFVYARNLAGTGNEVLAFSEVDGELLWACPVGAATYEGRNSPTVDTAHQWVLMASGTSVTAINISDGSVAWQTTLGTRSVINGSVTIDAGRAFVADYSPYGTGAKLRALYLEGPLVGQVAWEQPLNKSVGAEAAIHAATGNVIVTDYDGYIRKYSAQGAAGWSFAIPGAGQFFPPYGGFASGVVVDGDRVYAATYNTDTFAGEDSGLLVCVNAATGQQVWTTPCERTHSMPLVTGSLVIVSGGVDGYGSVTKVEAFNKTTGAKAWQWTVAGGWNTNPIIVDDVLYVGVIPAAGGLITPCSELYAVDITKTPSDGNFVIDHYVGAGSSPAYANGNIYTIGAAGLHAFGPSVAMEISASLARGWVYQNAGAATGGGHADLLSATIVTDPFGNSTYTIAVEKVSGSGDVDFDATTAGLSCSLLGSERTDGILSTGPCTLRVTVTGNENGGSAEALVTINVRRLGDIDGNDSVTTADSVELTKALNGVPAAGYTQDMFDLDCNEAVTTADAVLLRKILNGVSLN